MDERGPDPFRRFEGLMADAWDLGIKHAHAMTLSTVSATGQPSSRQVALTSFDERGFVFYTNLGSRKGEDLAANPRCSLTFYWRQLDRQVTILGRAEPVGPAEADAYFATRDRVYQWGAWASRQSRVMPGKRGLVARVALAALRHPFEVPRPPHWSGYRVVPSCFEFWAEGRFRLHERLRYRLEHEEWVVESLYP